MGTRGVRADPKVAGRGIGLAAVYEIVERRYRGRLEIGNNPLGGALVKMLILPAVLAGRCVLNASSRRVAVRT